MSKLARIPVGVNGGLLDTPRSVDELIDRFWGAPNGRSMWSPHVDVLETADAYVIRVELPGVDPETVDITQAFDELTVRGTKKIDPEIDGQTWRLRECPAGDFERRFKLPDAASDDAVEAQVRNGVLVINVSKSPVHQPRKIEIRRG